MRESLVCREGHLVLDVLRIACAQIYPRLVRVQVRLDVKIEM